MIKVNVNFFLKQKILSEKKIIEFVKLTSKLEKKIAGEVEVNLVGDKKIKTLNRDYRRKDKITDVLSFSWDDDSDFLGQIFICLPQIKRQASDYEVSEKQEFVRMLSHGLLHLVGYDHKNEKQELKMFKIQEKLVKAIL